MARSLNLQYSMATLFTAPTLLATLFSMVNLALSIQGGVTIKICAPIIIACFGALAGFAVRCQVSWFCASVGALLFLSLAC